MNDKKSNSGLKAIFAILAILAILLIANLIYMYNISAALQSSKPEIIKKDQKISKSDLEYTLAQKDTMMKNLGKLKMVCDKVIAQNTSMSSELTLERQKVVSLMAELQKSNGGIASIEKFSKQQSKLGGNVRSLLTVDKIKIPNEIAFKPKTFVKKINKSEIVAPKTTEIIEVQKPTEIIVDKKEELPKIVEKPLKISVSNPFISAFKSNNSGNKIETDKASKADFLKISFSIYIENQNGKTGTKTYQVQVIDSRNNVQGKKITAFYGDKLLTYSFETQIRTQDNVVQVNEFLPGSNFEKGMFFLNIFDKDKIIARSTVTLK
jgi:hypothetical protein